MVQLLSHNFFRMGNITPGYMWRNRTAISKRSGLANPTNDHQAEICMGVHGNGCCKIKVNADTQLLPDFSHHNKGAILTAPTKTPFGDLPYLVKALPVSGRIAALFATVRPSQALPQVLTEAEKDLIRTARNTAATLLIGNQIALE